MTDRDLVVLLEQIFHRSGYDLRGYAPSPLRLRMDAWLADHDPDAGLAELGDRLADDAALAGFLEVITEHDSPMFGDHEADLVLRAQVVPFLRTFPSINVWIPACASGGQAYATAIVLREEGLSARAHVYATDLTDAALDRARRGTYPMSSVRAAEAGYRQGGGRGSLLDYFVEGGEGEAIVRPVLRDQVTFLQHDLATGASFNEFHLIRCRDILPALGTSLLDRAFSLFHDSLTRFGVLALGGPHAQTLHPPNPPFELLDLRARLYRRPR